MFCIILTGCAFLDRHPALEKDLKAVEVQAIDDASSDAKEIIDGHGDVRSPASS